MFKPQPNSSEIDLWLKLVRAQGIGSTIFARLMDKFDSPQAILGASVIWSGSEGIQSLSIRNFRSFAFEMPRLASVFRWHLVSRLAWFLGAPRFLSDSSTPAGNTLEPTEICLLLNLISSMVSESIYGQREHQKNRYVRSPIEFSRLSKLVVLRNGMILLVHRWSTS